MLTTDTHHDVVVTEEDKLWEEDSATPADESNRERKAAQAAITELNRANEEALVSSSMEEVLI